MGRRYKNRSHGSAIVSDSVYIASRLPWWAAIFFGLILFLFFYFGLPTLFVSKTPEMSSPVLKAIESFLMRRVSWLEWIGIACGLTGLFFGFRNYIEQSNVGYKERGLVAFLVKIISKSIN